LLIKTKFLKPVFVVQNQILSYFFLPCKATGLVNKKTMFFYRLVNKAKLYLLISEKVEILAKRKQAKLILLQAYQ
jgi:uncharacterized C2H2 Zn-finger protein